MLLLVGSSSLKFHEAQSYNAQGESNVFDGTQFLQQFIYKGNSNLAPRELLSYIKHVGIKKAPEVQEVLFIFLCTSLCS